MISESHGLANLNTQRVVAWWARWYVREGGGGIGRACRNCKTMTNCHHAIPGNTDYTCGLTAAFTYLVQRQDCQVLDINCYKRERCLVNLERNVVYKVDARKNVYHTIQFNTMQYKSIQYYTILYTSISEIRAT